MGSTKELTGVPGLNPEERVVIKKLGFGSLNKLRSRTTVADISIAGSVNTKLDLGEYMKWMLIFGIKEADFFKGSRTVEDRVQMIDNDIIDSDTGEFILKQIQIFNKFEQIEELKKK